MAVNLKLSNADCKIIAEVLATAGGVAGAGLQKETEPLVLSLGRRFGKENILRLSAALETAYQANK